MAVNTEILDLTGLTYYDQLLKDFIKTADVATVSGHTVGIDVPADAKFTDTTYEIATTSVNGLMSSDDKDKVNRLGAAALSNSYNDLDDKPTIPSTEGFATREELNAKADSATTLAGYGIADAYTKGEVDGLIPDVSNFVTKAVSDLTNYYTKSETYTQAEVNGLVSAIPKFAIAVVDSLPTTGISATTIYLLKTSTTETGNLYTEYIYVNNAWEKLGTQTLDLSGYATKTELNGKVDKEDGKGLSTNDFTTSYKTAIDNLPTSYAPVNAQENVIETVKLNNTALTVTGKAVNISVATVATTGSFNDLTDVVYASNEQIAALFNK